MNYRIKEPKQVVLHAQGGSGAGLKQWVGLTPYEIQEIHSGNQHWGNFACAIEAKLKEKNKW
jgi:hypothetical protein